MPEVSVETAIGQMIAVLREAFEGPAERWSYFTDNRPDAGVFGTLAPLSAAEASRPVNGTTIAAHVHHVTFGLAVASARIRGDRTRRDWRESWRVSTVDDGTWERLREDLRRGYEDLREAIASRGASDEQTIGAALAAIAHAAYHLGAIRQKVAGLRAG